MGKIRVIVTILALVVALKAAPAHADTYAGMGFVAKHYVGYPYTDLGAYFNGSTWVYTRVSPWTYPSAAGTHWVFYSNWSGYTWLAQSFWWSYADNRAYSDAYAFSNGVNAVSFH